MKIDLNNVRRQGDLIMQNQPETIKRIDVLSAILIGITLGLWFYYALEMVL